MFPWNYGFHWTAGTFIFLGAFYSVLAVVTATLFFAAIRTRRALATSREQHIRWHSDFHGLPESDRVCRHELTGEFAERTCTNSFDCRECVTHAALVAAKPPAAPHQREEEVLGMPYPLDRLYHRGHTWVHPEADGTVTIGMDELGMRLVGEPDSVELPEPGTTLHVSGSGWRFRKRDAEIRVLSPVEGEVVETGGAALGWYLKVRPSAIDSGHLLGGAEIRPWLMREMERLQMALSLQGAEVPSLADGGVPVADIAAAYPQADWDAVCGKMFLEP